MLPDGNGDFASEMGMLIKKRNMGFGYRSWRYSAYVDDAVIKLLLEEPNKENNLDADPYEISSPESMYKQLKEMFS